MWCTTTLDWALRYAVALVRRCSLLAILFGLGCFSDPAGPTEATDGSTGVDESSSTQPVAESTEGTSSGFAAGSSGTSFGTTVTTAADGSTTAVGPSCGDGNTDAGEDCDDANEIDGDGCNTDCRESGSVVWVETLPNVPGTGTDTLNAVAVLEGGAVLAGGSRFIGKPEAFQSEANLVRFSPDGTLELDVDVVTSERDDSVRGLDVDGLGRIYVVGERDTINGVQSSGWVAQVDADGEPVGDIVTSSVGERSGFRAVATGPGLVTVVGFQGDGAGVSTHAASYSPMLTFAGNDDSVGSNPVETQSYLRDVVMDEHGIYVAGYRMDGGRLRGFTTTSPATGIAHVAEDPMHNTYIWGVALAEPGNVDSRLWSVGWTDGADFPLLAQLHRVSRAGELEETLPSYVGAVSEGAFYSSIVIGPAGDIIVAGGSLIGDGPNQFLPLVRRLDPEGDERWTRVFNERDSVRGAISGLSLDADGSIAVCGHASDIAGARRRMVAKLRP